MKKNLVPLESRRFKGLEEAEEYVSGFQIEDKIVECGKLVYREDGQLLVNRNKLVPFTEDSWRGFLREVVPGASRFINSEECPADLAGDIINRMLNQYKDVKRMIRIEHDGKLTYIKAFLSDGYKPYNNQQFIQLIKQNVEGKDLKVLRPSVSGGVFSVNIINPKSGFDLPEGGNNRKINLGVNYRNGEDGSSSVSRLPFSFDWFCENGAIFGREFVEAAAKRVIHRGEDINERVLEIVAADKSDAAEILKRSYINMANTVMTQLYFKHIAEKCIYPMKIMPQKEFVGAIPFDEQESRFGFFNRINEFAHKGDHDENKRLEFERLAGVVVEENLLV